MKQPELGKRLAELRQQKNLTQEELVEACNVSVRTIQRIESGDVTPRLSTIKILLSALETDLDVFDGQISSQGESQQNLSSLESWLQIAWLAGLVYFIVGFVDTLIEVTKAEVSWNMHALDISLTLYLPLKIIYWLSFLFFMIGFAKLGHFFKNNLLSVACYILIGLFTLQIGMDILSTFISIDDYSWIAIGSAEMISYGAVGIIFGLGLLKLQDAVGSLSKAAGILEIVAGGSLLVVVLFLLGFILYIPAVILEIVILYKAYEYIKAEKEKVVSL